MEHMVIDSIHQVLDRFRISYDRYEQYIDAHYPFNLREKDLFVEVFLDMPQGKSQDKQWQLSTGSFYTPPEVSDLIVEKTLAHFRGDPREARVLDLSAGTGNLLLAFLDHLKLEDDEARKAVMSRCHAYDIQWEPLVVLVNRFLLRFETFPAELHIPVQQCDALQMEIGERFDLILGNPPYIGEKGNKDLFREMKKTDFGKRFYESKMDYHYYFLYKGFELLSSHGVMGTITTNYHFTADGATKLRRYIQEHIEYREIINFPEQRLFSEAAGQHNVITIIQLKQDEGPTSVRIHNFGDSFEVTPDQLFSQHGYIQMYTALEDYRILDAIRHAATFRLGDFFETHQGIVSGADALSPHKRAMIDADDLEAGMGIFVLSDEEIVANGLASSPYLKIFYKNSDIGAYNHRVRADKSILYIDDQVELSESSPEYVHLQRFRPILKMRREVMNGARKWYALQWPRLETIFNHEKIVVPHRNRLNLFALSNGPFYASADVYYIVPRSMGFDLRVIAAILNSSLMYYWLFNMGKKKGKILELYSTPLKQIPIRYEHDEVLAGWVDEYRAAPNATLRLEIDRRVAALYGLDGEAFEKIQAFRERMGTEPKDVL